MNYSKIDEYTRLGGAYDRGACDAFYWRPPRPHYFTGESFGSTQIEGYDMGEEAIAAYYQGYYDQNDRKDRNDGSAQSHRKDLLDV
jgi:hypothetical protein